MIIGVMLYICLQVGIATLTYNPKSPQVFAAICIVSLIWMMATCTFRIIEAINKVGK